MPKNLVNILSGIKANLSREKEDQRIDRFTVGNTVDAKIVTFDLEKKKLALSIKELEDEKYNEIVGKYGSDNSGASIADVLGVALDKFENNKCVFYQGPLFVDKYCPAIISKNCTVLVHPTEDRYLNLREMASLMGMPGDFRLTNSHVNGGYYTPQMIGQNVPVNTVRDVASQVLRFIDKDKTLQYVTVNNGYYLQNNINKTCKEVSEKTTKKLF